MAEIKTVLTDDQIEDAANSCDFGSMVTASDYIYVLARAIEAAVLSANAGKVDAWQPIESAPQGTLSLFVDMGADEVRNLYFVDWMVGGLFCGIRTRNATHWMPLPAAPTQQAIDAGKA